MFIFKVNMTSIETEKVYPSDGFIVCLQTAWSGIYNIGVTTGAHSQTELLTANPDCIFDDIYDLKSLVIS